MQNNTNGCFLVPQSDQTRQITKNKTLTHMKKKTPLIISIAGTFLSAAAYAFFRLRKGATPAGTGQTAGSSFKPSKIPASTLYKTKGIKKVEVKVNQEKNLPGILQGEARVRPDEHDKYNVDVFSHDHQLIGHIEKNRRLCNSLTEWHHGVVFAFMATPASDSGDVTAQKIFAFLPVGLPSKDIEEIKTALTKLESRKSILSKAEIPSDEYLQILRDHQFIREIFEKLELLNEIDINLSKRLIPTLSKQLEEEENWESLLELEKHSPLIDELSERFAGATYRRISKARKQMGIKQ